MHHIHFFLILEIIYSKMWESYMFMESESDLPKSLVASLLVTVSCHSETAQFLNSEQRKLAGPRMHPAIVT